MVICSERIGIELILSKEAWRFNQRGIDTLSELYKKLTPYKTSVLGIGVFNELANTSECFLAVDLGHNGAIVGIVRLVVKRGSTGRYGIIHDVVVDTPHRGHGIGKALMKRVIDTARGLKVHHIDLTSKPARVEANQMFRSLGFVLVSAADPLDEENTNHYRLTL